jgi:hypothetical protein
MRARQREGHALSMRIAGATLDQIAEALGYYDKSAARKALARAHRRAIDDDDLQTLREREQLRLDDQYRRATEILVGNAEPGVKLAAIDRLSRISESFRKLMGLDAATRFEHSGPDGQPIPVELRAQQVAERVRAFQAGQVVELPPPSANGHDRAAG